MCATFARNGSDISRLLRKRVYNQGESYCQGYPFNLKRLKLEVIPQFLRDCSPLELQVAKTRELKTIIIEPVTPPRESNHLVKECLKSRCNKEVASQENDDSCTVDLKNVEEATGEKYTLAASGNESLSIQKSSPKPAPYSKKYPPPKIRTGVHVIHDFPLGCGEMPNSVSCSKPMVVTSGDTPLIQRPPEEMVNFLDEEPAVDQDEGAFGRKIEQMHLEDVNLVQAGSGKVVASGTCKMVCRPSECDPKQLEVPTEGGARMGTSYEKAMDVLSRESENFLLVKESNIQRDWMDLNRIKVGECLNLFDDIYGKLLKQQEAKPKLKGRKGVHLCVVAAGTIKHQLTSFDMDDRVFGAVPGIEVGDQFRFRAQLALIGLHCQHMSGIDYLKKDGKIFAISIVDSGRYRCGKLASDKIESGSPDVFFYSGQGGNPKIASGEPEDQKLGGGNLALINSMGARTPVRVIRKLQSFRAPSTSSKKRKMPVFFYDGLYVVSNCKQERGPYGKLVFKFQFNRINEKPNFTKCMVSTSSHSPHDVADADISQGAAKMPIRAVNSLNDEKPPRFNYVSKLVYEEKLDKVPSGCGCGCINGCSDLEPCSCLIKNGGEIPYNDNGAILKATSIVYECGSSCKCPPSCKNRVSQNGIRYQLEIFMTEAKGWGVRSQNFIPCGGFICEYVGELIGEEEAEERTNNDEYLFDIGNNNENHAAVMGHRRSQSKFPKRKDEDGFTIDAREYGNIARFINHSCSPNLYAQDVLYDHNDKRRPHVMLFAVEDIPPLLEISFDYNYKIDQVHDANGNIKKKKCFCGAPKCVGRMY